MSQLLANIMNNETSVNNDIRVITVNARRWFQRSYGNTYFAGELLIDGKQSVNIDFAYGYGDHCVEELFKTAQEAGKLPLSGNLVMLWHFCRDNNINLSININDVARKKDL